jgi:site-specific recombinase XerD
MLNLKHIAMTPLRKQLIDQMHLKGYCNKTIKSYVGIIAQIALHYHAPADQLTVDQIRDFILERITVGKRSKPWMNIAISAVKLLFCDVLRREWNYLDLPRPRRSQKVAVILSREEVRRIIDSKTNLKHKAILMLPYSAGLRRCEVRSLKVSDIDSARMLIHLHTAKGNKERYTILSPVMLDTLRQYYRKFRPTEWLFEGLTRDAISESTVDAIFKQALKKSKVQKQVGIHSLRHAFATHMLEQGVSLLLIQQLMGHKSLNTTSLYLHVQQHSIQAVQSPLDTLPI